jgi:hypothetical protein
MVVSLATFGEACKVLCAEDWRYDPAVRIKVRRDLPFSVCMLGLTSIYDTPDGCGTSKFRGGVFLDLFDALNLAVVSICS